LDIPEFFSSDFMLFVDKKEVAKRKQGCSARTSSQGRTHAWANWLSILRIPAPRVVGAAVKRISRHCPSCGESLYQFATTLWTRRHRLVPSIQ
jgi:hypothetical protein